MRKSVVLVLLAGGLAALGACDRQSPSADDPQPRQAELTEQSKPRPGMNVLFVSVDTTRADVIGCYGHPLVKTPHIDRMAAEGTRFAWCISSAPLTLVSHSSMMTGSYQFVHGARDNGIYRLHESNTTLAELFKAAGYATHAEVATVILNAEYGLDQGFDYYGGVSTTPPKGEGSAIAEEDLDETDPTRPPLQEDDPDLHLERVAEEVMDSALAGLRNLAAASKPFFMFVHCYDPHHPLEAPDRFAKQYTDPYYAEIAYFDEQFGRLMDGVRELGLAENTLVILTSDHGEGRGQHGEYTHSTFLYDSTQHVPLIFWAPGEVPAGRVIDDQVRLIDLAPTLVEFAGLEGTPEMQGASLLPLLDGRASPHPRPCYGDTLAPKTVHGYAPQRMLRADGWKYILAPKPELYHVAEDTLELMNLVDLEPQRSAEMRQQLRDLIAESPPPPGNRATRKRIAEGEIKKLQALGYLGDSPDTFEEPEGTELDSFEPSGINPRDRVEIIETVAMAMGAFRSSEFELAEKLSRQLLELEPEHPSGLSYLGSALMRQERYLESLEPLERCVAVRPDRWRDHRTLGMVYARLGRFEDAEASLRRAMELNQGDPHIKIKLGQLMALTKRPHDAMREFEAAVALAPDSLDARFYYGACLGDAGCPIQAADQFAEALRIDPDFMPAHRRLVRALRDSGRVDEAIAHLERALRRQAQDPGFLQMLADCLIEKKDFAAAADVLAKATALHPDNAHFRAMQGLTLLGRGDAEQAIQALAEAVAADPASALSRVRLGAALLRAGRAEEAIAGLEQAMSVLPEDNQLHRALAQCYRETGEFQLAITHYRRAAELNPQNADLHREWADALGRMGATDAAIDQLREALEIKPDYLEALAQLATVLDGADRVSEALEAYERLIEHAPGYALAYPRAALLLDRSGSPDQAIELLRRGNTLIPESPDIANDLAWRLATSPRSELRNGVMAVELAERVDLLTESANVNVLDTLAAAYAEAGRFSEAIATARKAVELARQSNAAELATRIASRLSLYEKQQPYREG